MIALLRLIGLLVLQAAKFAQLATILFVAIASQKGARYGTAH